jgi:flagellar biosynthetic protein FliR
MPGEVSITGGQLIGFLLVFTRVAGIFTFVPLPGVRAGLQLPRLAAAIAVTVALFGRWPLVNVPEWTLSTVLPLILLEAVFGQTIGLAAAVLAEAMLLGAQLISIQAGFSYGSMIDPVTQSESTALLVVAQLLAGLLFFAFGLERELLKSLIASLQSAPPGSFRITPQIVDRWVSLIGLIFSTGLRIAMPVIVLLVLVDLAFGVLSRINLQIQVVALLLSGKILITLAVIGFVVTLVPVIYSGAVGRVLAAARAVAGMP